MSTSNLPAPSTPRAPARPGGGPSGPSGGPPATAGIQLDPMRIARTYWPFVAAAGFLGLMMGVAAYVGLGRVAPRFTAESRIQMLPVQDAENPGEGTIAGGAGKDELELYMQTQMLVMTSDRILSEAIDSNEVRGTVWMRDFSDGAGGFAFRDALKDLRNRVGSGILGKSSVVSLSVSMGSPQDALIINNAIRTSYIAENRSQSTRNIQDRLANLISRIDQESAVLDSIETRIISLLRTGDIGTLNDNLSEASREIGELQPRRVEISQALTSTRETLAQREALIGGTGASFDAEQVAAGFVYPESIREAAEQNPVVQSLRSQVALLDAEIKAQTQAFGENHPTVRTLRRQLQAFEEQRSFELEKRMAEAFATELEGLRNSIPQLEALEEQLTEDLEAAIARQTELSVSIKELDELDREQNRSLTLLAELELRRADFELIRDQGGRARVIAEADLPDSRAFPKPIPIVGAFVVVITGLAVGLVVLKELRETRVRTPQDVASIPRTRVLGILPHASMDPSSPDNVAKAVIDQPHGAISESVRQIRSNLLGKIEDGGLKLVVIGSGMPSSGSTSVVTNLGASIAATGRRVLIIDANLRRPGVHTALDLAEGPGLAEVLREERRFEECVTTVAGNPDLYVMPAGNARAQGYERFLSSSMHATLAAAREAYDVVLIDVSPGVVSSDMSSLAGLADASILVVRAYNEKRGLVARLRNQLAASGATFLGVIVNGVKPAAGGYFKRNFEQTMSYSQQPKLVANTAANTAANTEEGNSKKGNEEA